MRKKILAVSVLILLAGLALLVVRARHAQAPQVVREVLRSELDLRDGVLYLHATTTPTFTGRLVEDFGKGSRKLAIDIHEGKVDGVSLGWFEGGQKEVEEHFVQGVSHGLRTRWHANGQKKSEENIEHGLVSGRYTEWHDNGAKAIEMTLKDGQPEGVALAWFPDGNPRSTTRFEAGKIVKREFSPQLAAAKTGETP